MPEKAGGKGGAHPAVQGAQMNGEGMAFHILFASASISFGRKAQVHVTVKLLQIVCNDNQNKPAILQVLRCVNGCVFA